MRRMRLVVEDDLSILTGVSMNLRFEGYEVVQAQDGERGLEMAVTDRPDLIVLDLMMPRLNGYDACRRTGLQQGSPGERSAVG